MKRIHLLSLSLVLFCAAATGQMSIERIYIKGGNSAWENYMKEIYLYPSFEGGIVEYKNGQRFKGTLNYNKVLGTIEFIDEKKDTLAITNEDSISFISIGNDVFIFNPSCVQTVKADGKVKLFKAERVRIADKQKSGSFGIPNSTGTIESVNRSDRRQTTNLDVNEDLLLSKTTSFFMQIDPKNIVPASKKNVLTYFWKHEESITKFLKTNNISFTREDDLIELAGYLSQL